MRITKLGHCCMLIETGKINILTDPGNFSKKQDELKDIDIVLITHEHADHLHVESLKTVLRNNPKAHVITNNAVSKIVEKEGITAEILTHGMKKELDGILIEGVGEKHAEIYKTVTPVENTGYFINDFFFPGDALTVPKRKVGVLALPVAGPWIKVSESIDYCLAVNPRIAFPVHDGMQAVKINARIVRNFVEPSGIKWHSIDETPLEF